MLFHMASLLADENKKWLNKGFRERLQRISMMLNMQGLGTIDEVDIIYNYNLPSATAETIANLNMLKSMGAISVETVMEKSDLIASKDIELERLKKEEKEAEKKAEKEMQRVMEQQGNMNGDKEEKDKENVDKK